MEYKVDDWMPINYWRPKFITDEMCFRLMFYHIRPPNFKVIQAESSETHNNETQIIEPGQVSLIVGLKPGYFHCYTITSNFVSKKVLWRASEYQTFRQLHQAKEWFLPTQSLFLVGYKIFNGPNSIKDFF